MTAQVLGAKRNLIGSCVCQHTPCTNGATQELLMRSDAYGEEWLPLCEEHAQQYVVTLASELGSCEWCKRLAELHAHRDPREGGHGRTYHLCSTCIERNNAAAADIIQYEEEDEEGELDEILPEDFDYEEEEY